MSEPSEHRRSFKTFEDLDCWKKCRELRIFIKKQVVAVLPPEEKYRLCDQLIRAARSTTANIAEGYGRFHYIDNAKFCSNARGSAFEVLDHLITATDEDLIDSSLLKETRLLIEECVKLINGYMSYLKRAAKSK